MAVPHLKLPIVFDAARLQRDLTAIDPGEWTPHFNQSYYDGDWSGVALRTAEGAHVAMYPDPTKTDFVDLPVLRRCSYIAEILDAFQCPLQVVRLLKLGPGSNIREHRDYNLSYEDGEVRVHIPIQTNDQVEFAVGGKPLPMAPGECWYINFNLPHHIHNRGVTDRVHLVIDCHRNPWLENLFVNA